MRLIASMLAIILLVFVINPPAHAASGKNASVEKKERLVLMPLKTETVDKDMLAAMETALVHGFRDKYKVYAGENVAKKAREIFAKESRTVKKECDETRCMQNIAEAFQAELIAVAAVAKRADGYFIALSIQNIFDNTVVFSDSVPCKGCDEYQVVDALKTLAAEETQMYSVSAGASAAQENEQLKGQITTLTEENNILKNQVATLQKEVEDFKLQIGNLIAERDAAEKRLRLK